MTQDVDDIFENNKRAKPIKTKKKGNRGELELVKLLNARFKDLLAKNPKMGLFIRAAGSGAFSHRQISESAKNTYTGDISAPDGFKFVLEHKNGYNDIDLYNIFDSGHKEIDAFLAQVTDDSSRSVNKKPCLIWKKDRKDRIVFVKKSDFPDLNLEYSINYRDWIVMSFEKFMSLDDQVFF